MRPPPYERLVYVCVYSEDESGGSKRKPGPRDWPTAFTSSFPSCVCALLCSEQKRASVTAGDSLSSLLRDRQTDKDRQPTD